MIAPFFAGFVMFWATSLSLGLFGATAFYVLFALFALILYLVTFERNRPLYIGGLTGVTIACELLTTVHPGFAVLFAMLLLIGQLLAGQYLTLTAPINRFILSLIWLVFWYNLLLYPFEGFFNRLLLLIIPFIIASVLCSGFYVSNLSTRYERS